MKEQFKSQKFYQKSKNKLEKINTILKEYDNKNTKMTLRQLYYQIVSRGYTTEEKHPYHNLCVLMTNARYCGLIDWDAIEDRIRKPHRHPQFDDLSDLIETAKQNYRLDRWKDQNYYVEIFTEKDALSSIIRPIADKWHVYLNINRGYDSSTAIYDVSKRFHQNGTKKCILVYFGDYDPSGLNMIQDINDRLKDLKCFDVSFVSIALTREQIERYTLPSNKVNKKDKRANWFIQNYGSRCWEVDALPPDVLISLVESEVKKYVDIEKMNLIIKQEEEDIERLEKSIGEGYHRS